jgi:type III secretion protein N (ATPase)
VVDVFGEPVDGLGAVAGELSSRPVEVPDSLRRPDRRGEPVFRAGIDGLPPLGAVREGDRVGLFSDRYGAHEALARMVREGAADVVVLGMVGTSGNTAARPFSFA